MRKAMSIKLVKSGSLFGQAYQTCHVISQCIISIISCIYKAKLAK